MNITVYLAANRGNDASIENAVKGLATWIGNNGHNLIYGGSKVGLMGVLASTALEAGAKVIGVEPQFFIEACVQAEDLTQLIVTPDMLQRKAKMIELGDAFVALPGGSGTLEELSEIMSMVSLGHTQAPCIIYNINGYYDLLQQFLQQMIDAGFSTPERQRGISFVTSLDELAAVLEEYEATL